MAGKRITKLVQSVFCLLGAAILLFAPITQAITYDVSLDWTLYGDLNQQIIPDIGDSACGPTSVVNSFVYLQNSYPEVYGHSLVPDLNGTPDIYENDEMIDVAEILISSSYMDTTSDGTYWDMLAYGKWKYIEERLPGSTIYTAQSAYGWSLPPVPEPAWVERVPPTWSFLFDGLAAANDIEILINGDYNHFLTVTGLHWDDVDEDGVIDGTEPAWMLFIDPWRGSVTPAGLWHDGPTLLTNYAGGTSFVSAAVAESPVPEPSSIVLAGIGLLGLAGLGRRKRKSA